jgi:hypothetical protein
VGSAAELITEDRGVCLVRNAGWSSFKNARFHNCKKFAEIIITRGKIYCSYGYQKAAIISTVK